MLPTLLATVGVTSPSLARAQQAPQPQETPAAPSVQSDDNEIIVRAERGDRSLIDRDTYVVRDTPLAQTRTAVDVIQNLPSVSVDANGQLRLLGSRNVKILIDGRDAPNANALLSTLQASQIARIEVMTNPSAQYSAYGSAGIINIILRRSFADGLGGSALVGVGSERFFNLRLSPTWSDGPWSISASPSLTGSVGRTHRQLERVGIRPDQSLDRLEEEIGRGTNRTASATTQISFKPSGGERYDLTGSIIRAEGTNDRRTLISSQLTGFAPFTEASSGQTALDSENLSLERTTSGPREGQELRLSLSASHSQLSARSDYAELLAFGLRTFALATSTDQTNLSAKADYTMPVGRRDTLSAGVEIQRERERLRDEASGDIAGGPLSRNNAFAGNWLDFSAYGTLQTQLGSLKLLPGLRVQWRRFEFDTISGLTPLEGTLFFPSLHVERPFGNLVTSFSIASRADWPSIGQFFPYRRVTGATTSDTGNPAIRPEHSLNIQAAARFPVSGQQVSLTLYSRRRSNVQDTAIIVTDEGTILSAPVNAGTRLNRGGQLSVRGQISPGWRYSASAWAADVRFDRLEGSANIRESTLETGANAQLDYSSGEQGKGGFSQATLNVRYLGPTRFLQVRNGDNLAIDLSYTHFLTDRLSVVASLSRFVGSRTIRSERMATLFSERTSSELEGPLLRVSLNYKLGK